MRRILQFVLCLCGFLVLKSVEATLLVNGDLSSGLGGWQTTGGVFSGVGEAALTDEVAAPSLLYQGVSLDSGTYQVGMDVREVLSNSEPVGYAKDTFFASLYFTSTPEQFDPRDPSGFDVAVPLFDLDASGAVLFTGTLEDITSAPGYSRFYGVFSLGTATTVFAVFELVDLNGGLDNSVVLVDNVYITVPEVSGAGVLAGLAACVFIFLRRKLHG